MGAGGLVEEKWVGSVFIITVPLGSMLLVKNWDTGRSLSSDFGMGSCSNRSEVWRFVSDRVMVSLC